jgi:hypothetical protein
VDRLESALGDPGTVLVPVWRDCNLVYTGGIAGRRPAPALPGVADAGALLEVGGELVWLGLLDGRDCFAVDVSGLVDPFGHPVLARCRASGAELVDLREVGGLMDRSEAGLLAYARGILNWHRRTAYCGSCGRRTEPRRGGHLPCAGRHASKCIPDLVAFRFGQPDGGVHAHELLPGRQHGWRGRLFGFLPKGLAPVNALPLVFWNCPSLQCGHSFLDLVLFQPEDIYSFLQDSGLQEVIPQGMQHLA